MKVRQLKQLEQIATSERLTWLAEGIALIAGSVSTMLREYDAVWKHAPRASMLLKSLAEEEAGKAFLLIDYARPPKGVSQKHLTQHLGRAYDHLARGIYAEYYNTRPASFGEVKDFVDRERVSFYLDGPEGFEWIFRNAILQRREEALYVDLVKGENELRWQTPDDWFEAIRPVYADHPAICKLLMVMVNTGLLTARALKVLQQVWSDISLTPETKWQECYQANIKFIQQIKEVGVQIPDRVAKKVQLELLFPLTELDLSVKPIDIKILEEQRDEAIRSWHPW